MAEFVSDDESNDSSFFISDSGSDATNYDDNDLYNDCYVEDNTAYYFERDGRNEEDAVQTIGNFTTNTNKSISLKYDIADRFLLDCARIEYNAVVENFKLHSIQVTDDPTPFDLLDIFWNMSMGIKMLKWVKEYYPDSSNVTITRDDLLEFIVMDLKIQYHCTSATHMYEKNQQRHYQGVGKILDSRKYNHIMKALNNGRGRPLKKGNWKSPIHINTELVSIFEEFGKICAKIGFIHGTSMVALDDDLWRLHSKNVTADGAMQINNTKKGMGVVHHASVSVTTGIYCGGYVQYRGDSTDFCVTSIQRILSNATVPENIKLNGTIFFMDRGYGGTDGEIVKTLTERGGNIHGTAKRAKSFPIWEGREFGKSD
jgi:hypothetical protein